MLIDHLPRRRFVIWSFGVVGITLVVLGVDPYGSLAVLPPTLLVLAFVVSAASDLESAHPSELFPTEIRAPGVGLVTSLSRVGAALSTFVLPQMLADVGVGPAMLVSAGGPGHGRPAGVSRSGGNARHVKYGSGVWKPFVGSRPRGLW